MEAELIVICCTHLSVDIIIVAALNPMAFQQITNTLQSPNDPNPGLHRTWSVGYQTLGLECSWRHLSCEWKMSSAGGGCVEAVECRGRMCGSR